MQIMHAVISRDIIYPRIFLIDTNKNLILFVNIYGLWGFHVMYLFGKHCSA